jgi:hypothetical protein
LSPPMDPGGGSNTDLVASVAAAKTCAVKREQKRAHGEGVKI